MLLIISTLNVFKKNDVRVSNFDETHTFSQTINYDFVITIDTVL